MRRHKRQVHRPWGGLRTSHCPFPGSKRQPQVIEVGLVVYTRGPCSRKSRQGIWKVHLLGAAEK